MHGITARRAQDIAVNYMSPRSDAINVMAQDGTPTVDLPREVYADIVNFKRPEVASQYGPDEYAVIMRELDDLHVWACNQAPKCEHRPNGFTTGLNSCGRTGFATDAAGHTYCDEHWHALTGE